MKYIIIIVYFLINRHTRPETCYLHMSTVNLFFSFFFYTLHELVDLLFLIICLKTIHIKKEQFGTLRGDLQDQSKRGYPHIVDNQQDKRHFNSCKY